MDKILCFDIGGTAIKYGIVDIQGNVLWKEQMPTDAYLGGESIVNKIVLKTRDIIANERICGIALSSAGIVDSNKGLIKETSHTMSGYKGTRLKDILEQEFKLRVSVENDVNSAALGEYFKGAAKDKRSVFMLTIGTGVGGSFILDGQVLKGNTFSVGEIGYLNIGGDCLDLTGSTRGIVQRVAKRKGIDCSLINGKEIFEMAKAGDQICIEEIDCMVDNITTVISMIAYILNPECIIIGGAIALQEEYLMPRFKAQLKSKLIPYIHDALEIKFACMGNDAGMIGASYHFMNS